MWNRYANIVVAFCLLGTVDQIYDDTVRVELTSASGREVKEPMMHLPLWMFPCEISEGSTFYFTKVGGVLELRCGTPPE